MGKSMSNKLAAHSPHADKTNQRNEGLFLHATKNGGWFFNRIQKTTKESVNHRQLRFTYFILNERTNFL